MVNEILAKLNGLAPEDFEPQQQQDLQEQVTDLTELVSVLVEVISND